MDLSKLQKELEKLLTDWSCQVYVRSIQEDGLLENRPMAILERRLGKVNNKPAMLVLIQWTNKPVKEATWEIYGDLITRFPGLNAVNEAIP
ncbi:reverse transcriptase [Tanacetum coccineum]